VKLETRKGDGAERNFNMNTAPCKAQFNGIHLVPLQEALLPALNSESYVAGAVHITAPSEWLCLAMVQSSTGHCYESRYAYETRQDIRRESRPRQGLTVRKCHLGSRFVRDRRPVTQRAKEGPYTIQNTCQPRPCEYLAYFLGICTRASFAADCHGQGWC
jgi:hypothetical protein